MLTYLRDISLLLARSLHGDPIATLRPYKRERVQKDLTWSMNWKWAGSTPYGRCIKWSKFGFGINHHWPIICSEVSIPLYKPMMHIAYSPYFLNVYKFPIFSKDLWIPHIFVQYTFICSPISTMMQLRITLYMYWTPLVILAFLIWFCLSSGALKISNYMYITLHLVRTSTDACTLW